MSDSPNLVSHDPGFAAYMRDVGRHALLTPAQERGLAQELVELRCGYWRQLLSYAPYTAAIADFAMEILDESEEHTELFAEAKRAARATRDSNKKPAI